MSTRPTSGDRGARSARRHRRPGIACSTTDAGGGRSSPSGGGAVTSSPAAMPGTEPTTSAEVESFAGAIADFYRVPDPLPPGAPGDLIRTMPIDAPAGEVGLRIMYHSTDADGDDRAVTGVVFHPTTEAPEGGWPIVAWAHGTSGLAASCAENRSRCRRRPSGCGAGCGWRPTTWPGTGGRAAPLPVRRRRGSRRHRQRRRGAGALRGQRRGRVGGRRRVPGRSLRHRDRRASAGSPPASPAIPRSTSADRATICPVPGARCPVPGARCPVPGARCQRKATATADTGPPTADPPPRSGDGPLFSARDEGVAGMRCHEAPGSGD